MKIVRLTETDLHNIINYAVTKILEIKNIATKSNITVCSLEDFKEIVAKLAIDDSNVEQYIGKYCFIEVGSCLSRLKAEMPHIPQIMDRNGVEYDGDRFYSEGQWYFSDEHPNVLKLEFDDNQVFNNKLPKVKDGFDGNTPATAVKLSPHETRNGKSTTFYYENGADFTDEMAHRLKGFVDNNLEADPNVKFVIHCKQGKSRSAAIASYVANKIGQFTDDFLSEYDNEEGESQFNIGMSRKGQPKYPHKNIMTKMGGIEGWSSPKKDTKEQWFYDRLINHPNTGFKAKKDGINNKRKTD